MGFYDDDYLDEDERVRRDEVRRRQRRETAADAAYESWRRGESTHDQERAYERVFYGD